MLPLPLLVRVSGTASRIFGEPLEASKQRRFATRFWALLPIALGLSVFLWGLQYKLSLYDPPKAASHQVPMAKLLSKNEQSSVSDKSISAHGKDSATILRGVAQPYLLVLLAVFILILPAMDQNQRWTNPSWRIRRVILDAFFVRPPPFLV